MNVSRTYPALSLSEGDVDGIGAGGVTEPTIQSHSAIGILVAKSIAVASIAETDVCGGTQAVRTGGVEALGIAVVDGAVASTDILRPPVAIDYVGVQGSSFGEVDGVPNEGEVRIGGGDPVVDLVDGCLG